VTAVTAFEMICVAVLVSGLSMIVLRAKVYGVLKRRRLLDRLGNPRRFFFSDALPVKLLFLHGQVVGNRDKALFWGYFFSWAIFITGLVLVVLGLRFPHVFPCEISRLAVI
jgi:hypothetical protein